MSSTAAAAAAAATKVALEETRRMVSESDLLIAEVFDSDATEATLRSVPEFHSTGSLWMSIPFRSCCAYSFANGRGIFC